MGTRLPRLAALAVSLVLTACGEPSPPHPTEAPGPSAILHVHVEGMVQSLGIT